MVEIENGKRGHSGFLNDPLLGGRTGTPPHRDGCNPVAVTIDTSQPANIVLEGLHIPIGIILTVTVVNQAKGPIVVEPTPLGSKQRGRSYFQKNPCTQSIESYILFLENADREGRQEYHVFLKFEGKISQVGTPTTTGWVVRVLKSHAGCVAPFGNQLMWQRPTGWKSFLPSQS